MSIQNIFSCVHGAPSSSENFKGANVLLSSTLAKIEKPSNKIALFKEAVYEK